MGAELVSLCFPCLNDFSRAPEADRFKETMELIKGLLLPIYMTLSLVQMECAQSDVLEMHGLRHWFIDKRQADDDDTRMQLMYEMIMVHSELTKA